VAHQPLLGKARFADPVTMSASATKIQALGQAGFVIERAGTRLVIDPYLSDSVAEQYGRHLTRQIPIVTSPEDLAPIDWILLTHAHLDHTDPATLRALVAASPGARFVAPYESRAILAEMGIPETKIETPPLDWLPLGGGMSVRAVPAAHVDLERSEVGECRYLGYLLRLGAVTVYHAGDTIPHAEIFTALAGEQIDVALLPVNERNFYRDRDGIVGNMTVREAFQMAVDLRAGTLIPVHWDLFAPNRTHLAEIELLYELERPAFSLEILPAGTVKTLLDHDP
jgi:L-ascorbate metabolism protein UlaG (beta-lactamase superfamily)